MKNLIKGVVALLKVKSIISLAVVFTTCYLTIKGELDTASFMALTGAIITYYFKKDDGKGEDEIDRTNEERVD